MAWAEDPTVYFNDLAVAATWTATGGSPVSVSGIFMRTHIEIEGIETIKPVFVIDSDTVDGVAVGDSILIDSITYTVQIIDHTSDLVIKRLILEAA